MRALADHLRFGRVLGVLSEIVSPWSRAARPPSSLCSFLSDRPWRLCSCLAGSYLGSWWAPKTAHWEEGSQLRLLGAWRKLDVEKAPQDVSWLGHDASDSLWDEAPGVTFTFRGCFQPWNTSYTFEHLPATGPTQCSFGLERVSRVGSRKRKLGLSLDWLLWGGSRTCSWHGLAPDGERTTHCQKSHELSHCLKSHLYNLQYQFRFRLE